MTEYADLTLIPRQGTPSLQRTLSMLERFAQDVRTTAKDHLTALRARIEQKHLPRLVKLRDSLDLALVTSVASADQRYVEPLEEYRERVELSLPNCIAYFLSNTAVPHPGTMSTASSAKYHLLIERASREGQMQLMVQVLGPNGVTSCHYHNETTEYFISLLGTTLIRSRKFAAEHAPWLTQRIEPHFMKMLPRTVHQLKTLEATAINLLGMTPGHHGLADHHYVDPREPF